MQIVCLPNVGETRAMANDRQRYSNFTATLKELDHSGKWGSVDHARAVDVSLEFRPAILLTNASQMGTH